MKLVIDIPEEVYDYWKEHKCEYVLAEAIKNGTPLNDCTDAISREEVMSYTESHIQEINTGYGDLNSHTNRILRMIVDYINSLPSVNPTTDLSKIRAEIIDKYMTADGRMGSVSADILKIIDKYSKGGDSDA